MANTEEETLEDRLKAALWFSVGKIVDEETLKMGVNATPQFIGALTELLWAQIGTVSEDLCAFAKQVAQSSMIPLLLTRELTLGTLAARQSLPMTSFCCQEGTRN
ncbi:MAG: hypothetical protein L6R40_005110 [Gallowayella cf. fulva]|nr:MAG: hypothetical protein L6R40_005110 [Xanthomendoza cf. fulva]